MIKKNNQTKTTIDNPTEKGTYAGVYFNSATVNALCTYIENNKIPNGVPPEKLHTTLLYSRKYCPNYKPIGEISPPLIGIPSKFEIWKTQDGKNALVLKYECEELVNRHKRLMYEHDATYDYPEYQVHVTLSYDVGNLDLTTLPDIRGTLSKIYIVEEYGEDLDFNWDKKLTNNL